MSLEYPNKFLAHNSNKTYYLNPCVYNGYLLVSLKFSQFKWGRNNTKKKTGNWVMEIFPL